MKSDMSKEEFGNIIIKTDGTGASAIYLKDLLKEEGLTQLYKALQGEKE